MLSAHKRLMVSTDMREQALGTWLFGLLEKSSPTGTGLSAREQKKQGDQYHVDGRILGDFYVNVDDPQFAANMFVSRAER